MEEANENDIILKPIFIPLNQAPFIFVKSIKLFFLECCWYDINNNPFFVIYASFDHFVGNLKFWFIVEEVGEIFSKSTSTPFCFQVWTVLFNTMIKNFLNKWCLLLYWFSLERYPFNSFKFQQYHLIFLLN